MVAAARLTLMSIEATTLRCVAALAGVFLVTATAKAQSPSGSPLPSDSEIRRILAERIDGQRQSIGMVVGVIEPQGRRIVAHGSSDQHDPRPLNGDTVFEIGSVTKVFTALLLADMIRRGEVALDDPVARYLPAEVKVPTRAGRPITLQDLASHTSGLPRLPDNFQPKDPANPYADYSVEQLYHFISNHQLTRDIGATFEYSNLGAGLLGHALARRAAMDYETLMRSRVLAPLGMSSTAIALSPELKSRLTAGHDAQLRSVPNWDLPTLAGAGALRSTVNDLLAFLATLGQAESPLASAMNATLTVRRPAAAGSDIALGWMVMTRGDDELIWHGGGTGGYRSFVGYLRKARVGVVVLSNTATEIGGDDIGFHLLDKTLPLAPAPKERKETAVDPKLFDGYVGRYRLAPNFVLTVTREGNRLFAQATGQGKAEIFPEGERHYFYKIVDAQITFEPDERGRAARLILHQHGRDMPALRIEE
jgi:serine-type D-Ala-D-Ala carboxypeptidase/endopeptidase